MMKTAWVIAGLLLAAVTARGIPNSVFGPVFNANSPLNGQELDEVVLGEGIWRGESLPGDWTDEGTVGPSAISHLMARPKLFGREVLLLRAVHRDDRLAWLEATFVDAGSYFGYFDEKLPDGLSQRELREELARRLEAKQARFLEGYQESLARLEESIAAVADRARPRVERFGKGRLLRAEPKEWSRGDLAIRLFEAEGRLLRVTVAREDETRDGWMDPAFAGERGRDRLARLAATVERDGARVEVSGIRTVPQGYRPYCGLNTLAMAARHFGMHLDEDWMAAAAGFRNTGSAAGSNMVKLYHAVAGEAGLSLDRLNRFDEFAVKGALDEGLPVIVWRRFSHDRNRLHDRVGRDPEAELPDPSDAAEQATWPGEEAPLHASVITGYDGDKREFFFLESWGGHDFPRRMRFEEMAATSYLCFVFGE